MKQQDPRFLNKTFRSDSLKVYFEDYQKALQEALQSVNTENLQRAYTAITEVLEKGRHIYVAGNGGSAAIADHLCCDFTKGTRHRNGRTLKTTSFVANSALMTALANDYGYEDTFSTQTEMFCNSGDILLLISSSGNSKNIINALESAKAKKVITIGFSGFSGGGLKSGADISLHVNFENYGIVEDCHQILMHAIAQYVALIQDKKN